MVLKVKDLVFAYSGVKILDRVSLELERSEVLGVIGPNGAGKSTLIRCMNRVLRPQSGKITLDGIDIRDMDRIDIARRMGYVPQASKNSFPATVFDTILMGRRPHGGWKSSSSDVKKALEVLKLVSLEDLAMRDFTELSGGQQQKVVLARALVQEAEVLLLDEPTSNLDIRQQLETMEIIRRLAKERGISALMAVHDLNLAARYADRIVMLKGGRVLDAGDPFSVLTAENIKAVYGVEAAVKEDDCRPYILPRGSVK
ncbi:MAG: ABC transporter ATP-binding protein [Methanotrichaceae archaeon]|nr:ABC transporter ATP-binding protein [Methanotrichaceae archaeon]